MLVLVQVEEPQYVIQQQVEKQELIQLIVHPHRILMDKVRV